MSSQLAIIPPLIIQFVVIFPAVIAVVELMARLPLKTAVDGLLLYIPKAVHLITSSKISDHWKEKVIPVYAGKILRASLLLAFWMMLLLSVFGGLFGAVGFLVYGDIDTVWVKFLTISTQLMALIIGGLYWKLRRRLTPRLNRDTPSEYIGGYSFISRVFHYMALNSHAIRESVFDIDCILAGFGKQAPPIQKPVYVTGLARAGTTILLEALFSTGRFATLTYRDMPFVTAPVLWRRLVKGRGVEGELKERAHGDRLLINYDSPEAFEEVFWKTVSDDRYIHDTHLMPQKMDPSLVKKYRLYVSHVVSSWKGRQKGGMNSEEDVLGERGAEKSISGGEGFGEKNQEISSLRYLAKNNNNLLRINLLKSAFPDAMIVVAFRNPLDHANSLLKQHRRFIESHENDRFGLQYMNWLGHHEFGLNMKPFFFSEEALLQDEAEADTLTYWLKYWMVVYSHLLSTHGENVFFFDYDTFCQDPKGSLSALSDVLQLPENDLLAFSAKVKTAVRYGNEVRNSVSSQILQLHEQLKRLALNAANNDHAT